MARGRLRLGLSAAFGPSGSQPADAKNLRRLRSTLGERAVPPAVAGALRLRRRLGTIMRPQALNFVIDTAALLVMLAMVATGLLPKWIVPPGSRGGHGLQLWGLTRHDWGDVHFWLAVALLVLAVVHVALHWAWVCALVARWLGRLAPGSWSITDAKLWLFGIGFLLACALLVAGFLWTASGQTKTGDGAEERGRGGYRGGRGAAVMVVPWLRSWH